MYKLIWDKQVLPRNLKINRTISVLILEKLVQMRQTRWNAYTWSVNVKAERLETLQ